jgi:hypothetical protein
MVNKRHRQTAEHQSTQQKTHDANKHSKRPQQTKAAERSPPLHAQEHMLPVQHASFLLAQRSNPIA